MTKRLRIKTDIVRLQFMRYFKNFTFMSEKRHIKTGSAFLSRFVCSPYNRFKNLSAAVNATRSANRILLKGMGLEPKVIFCPKLSDLGPELKKTDITQARLKRGLGALPNRGAQPAIMGGRPL